MNVPELNIPQPSSHGNWQSFANALTVALQQYDTQIRDYLNLQSQYSAFADDAAAAAGGVAVGEKYRTGSFIKVRVS